jgi:hypothetical protein
MAGVAGLPELTRRSGVVDGQRLNSVMPGLVPGIHALAKSEDVDGRDKPGHDGVR